MQESIGRINAGDEKKDFEKKGTDSQGEEDRGPEKNGDRVSKELGLGFLR